jgi:hypothetical protein
VVPDIHEPWGDREAVKETAKAARAMRPRRIVMLGDVADCYLLSRFGKTMAVASTKTVEDEIHLVKKDLRLFAKIAPTTWLEGNHEGRLAARLGEVPFLQPYAPDVWGNLAAECGVKWEPRGMVKIGRVLFMHGLTSGAFGGAAAMTQARRRGISVVQAHSHRAGLVSVAPGIFAMECGHLANTRGACFRYEPGAGLGLSGWVQAFGWIGTDGRPRLEVL